MAGGSSDTRRTSPRWLEIDEAESYANAVQVPTVEAVRTGPGDTPNRLLDIAGEQLTVTASEIEFPISTNARIPESRIVAVFVHANPGIGRWCGRALQPDGVLVYGAGAEHAGFSRPGFRITFVSTDVDRLGEHAEEIGIDPPSVPHAAVLEWHRSPATLALGDALEGYTRSALAGRNLAMAGDEVLRAFVGLIGSSGSQRGLAAERGLDSRQIVGRCVEFAEQSGRILSIGELCRTAHVSERRLRTAFNEEYDLPPSQYFRAWALDVAHRRLRLAEPGEATVTTVAADLGFDHLGRFAGHYQRLFGESPSTTLHTVAA